MTFSDFEDWCENKKHKIGPHFYSKYVEDIEKRERITDDFYKMLMQYMDYGDPRITICKLIRFMEHLYLDDKGKNNKELMKYAKLFGERMGKAMQDKLDKHRNIEDIYPVEI